MNKKTLNAIQIVLQRKLHEVNKNNIWKTLHEQYGIGTETIKGYKLTSEDHIWLENSYAKYVKINPLEDMPVHMDRLDSVEIFRDEKLSMQSVFATQLVCTSPRMPIPLVSGKIMMNYRGLVPTIELKELNIAELKKVLIIENGNMITRWHDWYQYLPDEWQDALFIYRGHGQNINYVKELILRLPAETEIAIYPDFDPQGLSITVEYYALKKCKLLISECYQLFEREQMFNQPNKYFQQVTAEKGHKMNLEKFPRLQEIFLCMQKNKLAIMQENIKETGCLIAIDIV